MLRTVEGVAAACWIALAWGGCGSDVRVLPGASTGGAAPGEAGSGEDDDDGGVGAGSSTQCGSLCPSCCNPPGCPPTRPILETPCPGVDGPCYYESFGCIQAITCVDVWRFDESAEECPGECPKWWIYKDTPCLDVGKTCSVGPFEDGSCEVHVCGEDETWYEMGAPCE